MRARPVLALTAALVGALLAPRGAGAAQPACGQFVTQSVRLEADLVCSGNVNGLVVGAANITIDLGATRSAEA
jgi:hypothetical protein